MPADSDSGGPGGQPAGDGGGAYAGETHRDRLLCALLLVGGCLLFAVMPFALRWGREFLLPMVAAGVISLALAPLADWMQSRGLPNRLASLFALAALVAVFLVAAGSVIQPAIGQLDRLPEAMDRVAARLSSLSGWLGRLGDMLDTVSRGPAHGAAAEVVVSTRVSIYDLVLQTPGVMLQILLTLLLVYFMTEARVRLRRQLLLERSEYSASLRAARVLREIQAMMAAYFATAFVVALGVGICVGLGAWAFGWDSPVMWGGLAALLNLLPYVGPLTMVVLLSFFGLSGGGPAAWSLAPALSYIALHTVEANILTPVLMGRRLAMSPVAILASLIYFGWIWGVAGVFLSVPLLVVMTALVHHSGRPNVIGFLLGEALFLPAARAPQGGDESA